MAASQGKKQASHGVLDRLQCRQRKRDLRYGDTGKICGGDVYRPRVSAAKNYQKGAYTDRSPLEYYENGKSIHILHPNTRELLERLLTMLAEEGEEATYKYIRREVLKNKK